MRRIKWAIVATAWINVDYFSAVIQRKESSKTSCHPTPGDCPGGSFCKNRFLQTRGSHHLWTPFTAFNLFQPPPVLGTPTHFQLLLYLCLCLILSNTPFQPLLYFGTPKPFSQPPPFVSISSLTQTFSLPLLSVATFFFSGLLFLSVSTLLWASFQPQF